MTIDDVNRSEDGYYAITAVDVIHYCVRGTAVPKMSLVGREGEQWHPAPTAPHAVALAALLAAKRRK